MNDTNKNEPQPQEQKFNKIISIILTIIGLILIAASPILLTLLLLADSEVKYANLIIVVLLFVGGCVLLRTKADNNSSQDTTGRGTGDANAIFSAQHVLIGVTIFNIVLFVGGTILADLKVDSIQKMYDKAIETVKRTEKKYNDAETKLLEMENRTILRIGEITADVEKKKMKGCEVIETVVKEVEPLKEKVEATKINLHTLTVDLASLDKEFGELKKETSQKFAIAKEEKGKQGEKTGTLKSGLLNAPEGETKAGIPNKIFWIFVIVSLISFIGVIHYFKFGKKERTS